MLNSIFRTFNGVTNGKLHEAKSEDFLQQQKEMILEKSLSPLYLKAVSESARSFKTCVEMNEFIRSLPSGIPGLFDFILSRLAMLQ